VETQEISVQANVNRTETKASTHKIKTPQINELIILPKLMERPPGCSFIGSSPSTAIATLGQINGLKAEVIIDSGSDITLVSPKTLDLMLEPPNIIKVKGLHFLK